MSFACVLIEELERHAVAMLMKILLALQPTVPQEKTRCGRSGTPSGGLRSPEARTGAEKGTEVGKAVVSLWCKCTRNSRPSLI